MSSYFIKFQIKVEAKLPEPLIQNFARTNGRLCAFRQDGEMASTFRAWSLLEIVPKDMARKIIRLQNYNYRIIFCESLFLYSME